MNMSFIQFLAGAVVISLSGVMAPGPMSAVTAGKGSDNPHAGAFVAIGHGIVEFPLMVALFLGAGFLFGMPYVRPAVGCAGGLFLLYMAAGMFRGLGSDDIDPAGDRRSPVVAGIVLSAANPYFLIWWITVGMTWLVQSAGFGIAGLVIFMIVHWLCDLAWCWFLSALSNRGGRFFGRIFQKVIFAVSGVALLFFGGKFLYESITAFLA